MQRSVLLHRRVQKRLREGKVPAQPVAECIFRFCSGRTDSYGLRMKRLTGIDVPVFEARVDRDIRLVFTVQGSTEYDGGNSVHIRDRIVVWNVDHHDDALNRARRLSYDRLHALEPCSVACLLTRMACWRRWTSPPWPNTPSCRLM